MRPNLANLVTAIWLLVGKINALIRDFGNIKQIQQEEKIGK